jgi:hypothetical protein
MGHDEAYRRARDEFLQEAADQYARERRGAILDMRKESSRHRYYAATRRAIQTLSPKHAATALRLAFEAKLVGVNLPFLGNRRSVDAQYVALRRQILGGFSSDLERAGLLKVFASKHLEDKWTDELFELNRDKYGKPGITKDAKALEIAKIVRKWQTQSMAMLNREGAWVRSYSGYVTRTSHDPHAIGQAGMHKWVNDTFDRLDLKRTFGTSDRQASLDALRAMWGAMRSGDHFDYGKPIEEPLFPSVFPQFSQRILALDGVAHRLGSRAENDRRHRGFDQTCGAVVFAVSDRAVDLALPGTGHHVGGPDLELVEQS